MDTLFSKAATRLTAHLELGKPGEIVGTRVVIPQESYRSVSEVDGEMVWILAVVHTARQWLPVRE
jgi:plasmid stabilization system protein ParE